MAKYEWTMYQIQVRLIMLSCTEISFVISFSQFWEIWSQTLGFLLRNSIKPLSQNLEKKVILTCFTKIIAEQSSVIQYAWPMCHNERGIIVLSFSDISFVILLFVFQRSEIKSGFPSSSFFVTLYNEVRGTRNIVCYIRYFVINISSKNKHKTKLLINWGWSKLLYQVHVFRYNLYQISLYWVSTVLLILYSFFLYVSSLTQDCNMQFLLYEEFYTVIVSLCGHVWACMFVMGNLCSGVMCIVMAHEEAPWAWLLCETGEMGERLMVEHNNLAEQQILQPVMLYCSE